MNNSKASLMTAENVALNRPMTAYIADDHPIFRQGLAQLLNRIEGVTLIGEADNGKSALVDIIQMTPDIAILDLAMPEADGLTVLKQVKAVLPHLVVIIMTSYDDKAYLEAAFQAGAAAYLIKDGAHDEILNCLQAVCNGQRYMSAAMDNPAEIALPQVNPQPESAALLALLSPVEKQVLQGVATFKTSKEIADELGIAYRTVQNHRARICAKLQLKGRHQLMQFARKHQQKILSTQ